MSRLSDAIERLKSGRMIILVDDEDRENEGDLVMAAQFADGPAIAFMARQASGLICLTLEGEAVDRLGLPPMVADNRTSRRTAFTVSIEASTGVDTGISAFDRARTIAAAIAPDATAADLVSPGHVFPLRAVPGGVLARAGHTEGSVDLMKLAGLAPAGVICEIMKDDGTMARMAALEAFSRRHDVPILTIAEVAAHRMATEVLVDEVAAARLPSVHGAGSFEVRAFRSRIDGSEHLALIRGPLSGAPLVRAHSECLTGDALGSQRCDCGAQLREGLKRIGDSGDGVLLYLRGHEGRGLGLANKIAAYALQDEGLDTVEANHALGFADDLRDYGVAAQILKALGVDRVRLLSNNPRKAAGLRANGLTVSEELPLTIPSTPHNAGYLDTKRDKLGHRLARAS
ncbi:3,4-dihydroxy-2-butanone 4-phosphate synthase [Caulobacter sp. Root655]|uniref:bifunctional 3,4-dihydroxy-2-butanone-4-phosphate synthase/GTP cyclohydrolase II n=1 Tax=Caulobacter sp. Root655 TaxID=1736578 RepID=UPI0006F777AC|nr:bifunctional 3,4-dihydroxy-2-butanone-4-phosphate synthase/GTP cyclohydrolase II [Caulobacter sp. Root655]KRA60085.1 3,4-dihydroxy-2-butanone 4-phosphate synthase [Caulobacter sp. Root655]